jgi:aspartate dehydrogenase
LRVLIIGLGSIGSTIAQVLDTMPEIEQVYVTDQSAEHVNKIKGGFKKLEYTRDITSVLPYVELVVEAASQEAVRRYARTVVSAGKSLLIMSVGALADEALRTDLETEARKRHCKIYIPSGAIAGIDGLAAASVTRIDTVTLISTKNPKAYTDVVYVKGLGIDLDKMTGRTLLFKGFAEEAVRLFPKNVNVAAAVALTGIGFKRTAVEVYADPAITTNNHRLVVNGEFGELVVDVANNPFPKNPRTSFLAALSAISAVKKILSNVWTAV